MNSWQIDYHDSPVEVSRDFAAKSLKLRKCLLWRNSKISSFEKMHGKWWMSYDFMKLSLSTMVNIPRYVYSGSWCFMSLFTSRNQFWGDNWRFLQRFTRCWGCRAHVDFQLHRTPPHFSMILPVTVMVIHRRLRFLTNIERINHAPMYHLQPVQKSLVL